MANEVRKKLEDINFMISLLQKKEKLLDEKAEKTPENEHICDFFRPFIQRSLIFHSHPLLEYYVRDAVEKLISMSSLSIGMVLTEEFHRPYCHTGNPLVFSLYLMENDEIISKYRYSKIIDEAVFNFEHCYDKLREGMDFSFLTKNVVWLENPNNLFFTPFPKMTTPKYRRADLTIVNDNKNTDGYTTMDIPVETMMMEADNMARMTDEDFSFQKSWLNGFNHFYKSRDNFKDTFEKMSRRVLQGDTVIYAVDYVYSHFLQNRANKWFNDGFNCGYFVNKDQKTYETTSNPILLYDKNRLVGKNPEIELLGVYSKECYSIRDFDPYQNEELDDLQKLDIVWLVLDGKMLPIKYEEPARYSSLDIVLSYPEGEPTEDNYEDMLRDISYPMRIYVVPPFEECVKEKSAMILVYGKMDEKSDDRKLLGGTFLATIFDEDSRHPDIYRIVKIMEARIVMGIPFFGKPNVDWEDPKFEFRNLENLEIIEFDESENESEE